MESGAAEPQTKEPKATQGRADLRATTQPDPAIGRGSSKKILKTPKKKYSTSTVSKVLNLYANKLISLTRPAKK